jgi:hypothetical protein
MATIRNNTSFTLKFAAYRADGLLLASDTPTLGGGECLDVRGGDTKGIDWFILLIFLKDSKIPPAVNITQAVSGVGVTLGVSVVGSGTGGGITLGVNTVGTIAFSTPLAGHVVQDGDFFKIEARGGQLVFNADPSAPDCSDTKKLGGIIKRDNNGDPK